jgi:hypothetical protein
VERLLLLLAVAAALVIPTAVPAGDRKGSDYQKMADAAEWLPPEQEGFLDCLAHGLGDYQVEVIRRKGAGREATIRVSDRGKEVYSWDAHLSTVFWERDGVLYHAEFSPQASGCAVVAYDLKAGKRLWRAELKGLGREHYSKYSNAVRLQIVNDEVLSVYGHEAVGRYVEIVDRKTGKTVGHKVFSEKKKAE